MKTQPKPKKNKNKHVVDEVIAELKHRKKLGLKKYGVALQAFNGRNAAQDLYEEHLDYILYTKQLVLEWKALKRTINAIYKDLPEGTNKNALKRYL